MNLARLRIGELVAGLSAVGLLLTMLLPWYGSEFGSGTTSFQGEDQNAFQAFDVIWIVLLGAVVGGIGLALFGARRDPPGTNFAVSGAVASLGALAVMLIGIRILSPPELFPNAFDVGGIDVSTNVETTREVGAYLGLITAGGVGIGAWLAMREQAAASGAGTAVSGRDPFNRGNP